MRIVTWNHRGGDKLRHLAGLEPDVAILQETPARLHGRKKRHLWFGAGNRNRGLAIVVAKGWRIEQLPLDTERELFGAARVSRGAVSFDVLGCWAKRATTGRYRAMVYGAIRDAGQILRRRNCVFAGDFNLVSDRDLASQLERDFGLEEVA